jgi:predicted Zn-dependent protease
MILDKLQAAIAAARAAGATDVEVSHAARRLGMARFASSAITTSGVVDERVTRVRAAVGDRVGAATTSGIDAEALAAAAAQAVDAAEHGPSLRDFPGSARASLCT